MHSFLTVYLWASALLLESTTAEECVPLPLSMGIKNVSLSTNHIRRGVALKVGSPEQEFSFLPRWNNNNTILYGPKCDVKGMKYAACQTYRGGLYVPDDSKTIGKPKKDYEPLSEPFPQNSYDIITETINWSEDMALQDFPLARPVNTDKWDLQGYSSQNIIGMDSGSTILEALKNAGRIASKSFGFWWGLDGVGEKDQKAGSFVLGGYDRAKAYGDGLTTQLTHTDKCPTGMVVSIADILLNFRNGTDTSIFEKRNGGTTLQACLLPDMPIVMAMPVDPYFYNLQVAIENVEIDRSMGIDFWNVVLSPDFKIFSGDLTFKLEGNLDITIPNRQLIVPDRTIKDNGATIANASRPVIRINSLQDSTQTAFPYLGRYFLTAAYVVSNSDANEFTLYQANPSSEEDLVALGEDNKSINAQATCTVQPTASADPGEGDGLKSEAETPTAEPTSDESDNNSSDQSTEDKESGSGLLTGAVVGIAVGVCVPVIAGAVFLIWFIIRRNRKKRRKQQEAEKTHQESTAVYMACPSPGTPKNGWPTQGVPHFIPQEMATDNQPKMRPVELPT
ncbi:hypothetical protein FPOA_08802 [Fusarium poae]|uniref:Peptidase A1 domain-containing protein n=1 Tax=Fusarium poae TaxID=36050 RepID=A0A1B8APP8_FUSPO|nr:hypothetical protein FPOA_08802 [Fusarium poae]